MKNNEVVITGLGLVSSLGEGNGAHWNSLTVSKPAPVLDSTRFEPFTVHPLPEIDWSLQVPRRGDLRQMDNWQRLGVYTAGMALDDAGIKGDEALCGTMDMIVAAGGGERDQQVDEAILEASRARNDIPVLLNEKLTTELRPTLFLAQLSNLMAGNISIVHKVTGSSRTFMGEDGAGISAMEHAFARIRAGQSTHCLVGAAYNTEALDFMLPYEFGVLLHEGEWKPVWQHSESPGAGMLLGSGSAFLVLEERAHAENRNARIYARITDVVSDQLPRNDGYEDRLVRFLNSVPDVANTKLAISAASGIDLPTRAEKSALEGMKLPFRATSTIAGYLKEAQMPFAVAISALAIHHNRIPSAFSDDETSAAPDSVNKVLVTTIGAMRSEGAAILERVSD